MSGERRGGVLVVGLIVAAPVAWLVVVVLPQISLVLRVGEENLPGLPSFVTSMIAGGAAAGCLVALAGSRASRLAKGAPAAVVATAGVVGSLGTAAATFLLAGGSMAGWWPPGAAAGSEIVAGLTAVALVATASGLALGLLAALGPVWGRACALVVPILFAQDALTLVLPVAPGMRLGTVWFLAVLAGGTLGLSVAAARSWTWVMWAPALALVWLAQSLRPAISAAMQQVHLGAESLRSYPLEPFRVLAEHLGLTLIDPGTHGPASLWVIMLVVGAAVVGWRLRAPR